MRVQASQERSGEEGRECVSVQGEAGGLSAEVERREGPSGGAGGRAAVAHGDEGEGGEEVLLIPQVSRLA